MQRPSAAKRALQFTAAFSLAITLQTSPSLAQSGSNSILIGDLQPVTGPGGNSALTQSVTQGTKSAISDLNAHGGAIVGGKKYEFTYKAIDTRSEPAATLAAAKELIQDNAVAAILPALAGTEIAYRALSEGKVISFTSAPRGMNPLALDPTDKHPYLFATIELTDPVIEGWLGAILSLNPGVKRVAVLNLTDPGGKLMDAGVQRAAHKLGLEYVGAEFVDISTTDFSGPLTNLKAKKPDVIYFGTTVQVLAATRQAIQLEAAPILWNFAMRPVDLKQIGPLGKSTVVMADFRAPYTENLTPPEMQGAVNSLGKLASGEPLQAGMASSYFDWLHLFARAIEKANTLDDRSAIAKALVGLSYDGPFGRVEVLPNHTTAGPTGIVVAKEQAVTIYVYKNGASTQDKPISTYRVANAWSQ